MRYGEGGIFYIDVNDWESAGLTFYQYKDAERRYGVVKIRSSKGRPAEVEYETLPQRFKDAIIDHFGDPYQYFQDHIIDQYLKPDSEAFKYYTQRNLSSQQVEQLVLKA
ncbi:MAG: hypothetical protein GC181_13800, partial [Bacteroidetes bacterium]|nr:hypothetical protein [Bacteroidota bacterium]